MSRIAGAFQACRARREGALVCYLTAGYPDEAAFEQHFLACVQGGADVMEVGVPFSDPVADGPTIQRTSQAALEKGAKPRAVLASVRRLRAATEAPIVLMGYYNPIFRMGDERFVSAAAEAGADGLIVADMPLEESGQLHAFCRHRGLDLIQLASPLTQGERLDRIAAASEGYLYLVIALGTTGARKQLPLDLPRLIARARASCGDLPLAVGFGISGPEHVGEVVRAGADGAIVGSALLSRLAEGARPDEIRSFVGRLKAATRIDRCR